MPPCPFAAAPTRYGPTNPPSEPIEVINAMPEAAAVPERKSLGSDQKGPWKPKYPIPANVQSMIDSNGDVVVPSRIRAVPPTSTETAAWYRRSILRSELREMRIITTNPAR